MAARANAENFEELVLKSELPVLVDFYSDCLLYTSDAADD